MNVGPPPGWNTKSHKRYISRDQVLLKKLEEACKGGDGASKFSSSPQRRSILTHRVEMEASEALRQHFSSRTTAFLVPLQRYLNTLIPTPADRSAPPTPIPSSANFHGSSGSLPAVDSPLRPHTPLRMRPFNETAFFASLKANGALLPFKSSSKRREFYERWLRTSAFGVWIAAQEEVVNGVLAQDVIALQSASRNQSGASLLVPPVH